MAPYLFWIPCLIAMGASYIISDAYNSLISGYSVTLSLFFFFFSKRECYVTLIRVEVNQYKPLLSLYLNGQMIY